VIRFSLLWISRLPFPQEQGRQPSWSTRSIYAPQWQGAPVIPPGTGFPFRRLLRPAWLRWRCSNALHTKIKK
jgi:hypothetical protein